MKIEKKLKSSNDGNVVTIFFLLIHVGVLDACFTVGLDKGRGRVIKDLCFFGLQYPD